jgi:hypothetical protein
MIPLNFGAPALEELAVPDYLSTPRRVTVDVDVTMRDEGETAVVDIGRRAACRKHSLASFHICCRRLESVSHHEGFILLSFNYFVPCFTSYSYLDGVLSPFFIR